MMTWTFRCWPKIGCKIGECISKILWSIETKVGMIWFIITMSVRANLGTVYVHNYCMFIIRGPNTEGLETKLLFSLNPWVRPYKMYCESLISFQFFSNFLKLLLDRWSDLHQNSHTAARDGDGILICWSAAKLLVNKQCGIIIFFSNLPIYPDSNVQP